MYRVIGVCGLCGGSVCIPEVWMGVFPPAPTCSSCHAVAKASGPVVEMEKPRTFVTSSVFPPTK